MQKQEKPFRVEFGETIPQNMWMPYGLESAAGYDAMAPLRTTQFLGAVRTGQANTPYGRVVQVENYNSKLFDLLNIKYLLAVKYDVNGARSPEGEAKSIFQDPKFKLVFEDKSVQIYENRDVLPRAFLVHEVVVKKTDQDIIDQILDPRFDLNRVAVLEEDVDLTKAKFDSEKDEVAYLSYGQNSSVIKTNSEAEGILFVSDSFYPGWQVTVDGQVNKIYRANYNFRAVIIPPGEHQVVFQYKPRSFKIGVYLSGTTLILLIFSGLIVVYRRKRK